MALLIGVATAPVTAQDFLLAADTYDVVHDQEFRSEAISVLDNDLTLPDGRLVVSVTREPAHGQLTMNANGTFVYVPDPGYLGDDSFEYIVDLIPLQELTFVENASLDLVAKVSLALGNDTDSEIVQIVGTVRADIGPVGNPVERVQLVDLSVRNRDPVGLKFNYPFSTLRINVDADSLQLRLNSYGPPTTTLPPLGQFSQTGNKLGLDAVVKLQGTGLLTGQVPSDPQNLTTETDIDLSGFVINQNDTITLILNVDSQNQFDLDGNAVEMGLTGQLSATGPHLPGSSSGAETVNLRVISPTAIAETGIPGPFRLLGLYPNPITTTATIEYELERPTDVRISIYDILGREVDTLPAGLQRTGRQSITWDASNLSRGIYLLRITTETQTHTRPVVVR